jgi:hypothetical protein
MNAPLWFYRVLSGCAVVLTLAGCAVAFTFSSALLRPPVGRWKSLTDLSTPWKGMRATYLLNTQTGALCVTNVHEPLEPYGPPKLHASCP